MNSHKLLIKIAFWCITGFFGIAPMVSLMFPQQGSRVHYQPISLYWGETKAPYLEKVPGNPARSSQYASRKNLVSPELTSIASRAKNEPAKAISAASGSANGVSSFEFPRLAKGSELGIRTGKEALAFASQVLSSSHQTPDLSGKNASQAKMRGIQPTENGSNEAVSNSIVDIPLPGNGVEAKTANLLAYSSAEKTANRFVRKLDSLAVKNRQSIGIVLYRF